MHNITGPSTPNDDRDQENDGADDLESSYEVGYLQHCILLTVDVLKQKKRHNEPTQCLPPYVFRFLLDCDVPCAVGARLFSPQFARFFALLVLAAVFAVLFVALFSARRTRRRLTHQRPFATLSTPVLASTYSINRIRSAQNSGIRYQIRLVQYVVPCMLTDVARLCNFPAIGTRT